MDRIRQGVGGIYHAFPEMRRLSVATGFVAGAVLGVKTICNVWGGERILCYWEGEPSTRQTIGPLVFLLSIDWLFTGEERIRFRKTLAIVYVVTCLVIFGLEYTGLMC